MSAAPTSSSHDFDAATYLVGLSGFISVREMPGSTIADRFGSFASPRLSVYAGDVFLLWVLAPLLGNDVLWRVVVLAVLLRPPSLLSLALMRVPGSRRAIS